MTSCYKNVLQVRRKAVETGCVNIFWLSLFVFVCYYVQPQTEDFEPLLFFPTAWLAHFAHVEILFIQQTLMHPKKGQEWEKKCVNGNFPRLDWDHRSPQRISWVPTPVQSSIMHRFSGRGGSSGQRLFLLGEFANVCKLPWRWCPGDRMIPFGEGFPSVEPLAASVPDQGSTSRKTDPWAFLTSGHWLRISRDKGYLSSVTVDSYHQGSLGSSPQGTSKPWNFQREP